MYSEHLYINMTENKTIIRVTEEELSTLAEAADMMYGKERHVPRGAVVRRLSERYLEEATDE
ncbi:hypothetical protein J2753_000327 [Halolamina salifodinae]|uniref:Uncharacterized protein n=2 Tax=Halolamina salifodinae TaxID=1202767 RepID=A0A8T4GVY9_9EURY|nr:hypothetical protein [Halolamina salifodinae]